MSVTPTVAKDDAILLEKDGINYLLLKQDHAKETLPILVDAFVEEPMSALLCSDPNGRR